MTARDVRKRERPRPSGVGRFGAVVFGDLCLMTAEGCSIRKDDFTWNQRDFCLISRSFQRLDFLRAGSRRWRVHARTARGRSEHGGGAISLVAGQHSTRRGRLSAAARQTRAPGGGEANSSPDSVGSSSSGGREVCPRGIGVCISADLGCGLHAAQEHPPRAMREYQS